MRWQSVIGGIAAATALSSCGGGDKAAPDASRPATTAAVPAKPPERPVVLSVNGEKRRVRLSQVDFRYCRKHTDLCSAIRGANFPRLSPAGKRAVLEARRRKRARERQEAIRRQQIEQQRQRQRQAPPQPPPPRPQPEGTTTG